MEQFILIYSSISLYIPIQKLLCYNIGPILFSSFAADMEEKLFSFFLLLLKYLKILSDLYTPLNLGSFFRLKFFLSTLA